MDLQFGHLGNIIKLAIAPAFLLAAAGMHLRVLNNRLSRIVDREVQLDRQAVPADEARAHEYHEEQRVLRRRRRAINRSLFSCLLCALLVCGVILVLFLGDMPGVTGVVDLGLNSLLALLFITGMISLVASYLFFLDEIFLSIRKLKLTIRGSANLQD